MSVDNNTDAGSVESRVVQLIENALDAVVDSEKVSFLMKAQEFVIHHDILDNFLEEMMNFQSDRSAEIRKFVAGFIETVCKKDSSYFPKVIDSLKMMLADEVANVLKKAIQVSTQLYKVFLIWLSTTRVTEETSTTFKVWSEIKNYIFSLIDSTENDGIRTQCIKFIENVIICQTRRDSFSPENDHFSLDQVIVEEKKSMINVDTFEEESVELFEQLVSFQAKIHISSVNLMATMQSLSLIARQRPKLFFNKVVEAFETLSANLPPTLAKSQVNSVNKQLKLLFIILFKHPFVYSTMQHPKLSQILLKVGATQSEINRCLNDVKKRGIKTDYVPPIETKRIKLEPEDDNEDSSNGPIVNEDRTPPFDVDKALNELSKRISRHDSTKATEITAQDLQSRLSDANITSELVLSLLPLVAFPEKLEEKERVVLATALANPNQVAEIAKHFSIQFTAACIGPGVEEMISKYVNLFGTTHKDAKLSSDINTKIAGLVKKNIAKEMKKHEAVHHKVKLAQSNKQVAQAPPPKPKHFNLVDITRPLNVSEKFKFIEGAVIRILSEDENGPAFSASQLETRHKILGKFLSDFSGFESLKSLIKAYIFKDIRNRYDIFLNMLYFEYVTGKQQNSSLDYFASCLQWVIQNIINTCEAKDKDYFLNKFYLESPFLTENVIDLLKTFTLSSDSLYPNCAQTGVALTKILIEQRVKHRMQLLDNLLQISTKSTNLEAQTVALVATKELYANENLKLGPAIEEFALKHLNLLSNDAPESTISGAEEGSWNEDAIKSCLSLYLLLLPLNEKLIHHLPTVFVSANPNAKRLILRYIQSAIEALDMNSPEVLRLVETCPDGTDVLISRIIHILTEKRSPSIELIIRVKELYPKRISDVRIVIPVLTGFSKKEIITLLPNLIKLNPNVVKEVFKRLLSPRVDQSSSITPISPADLLIALHNLDLTKCDLKTILRATNLCFEEKNIYTAEVLAVVMQMLIEQNPLPTLLMRTVIQTLSNYPRLITFVMNNILQRLIVKQVWSQKKVWEGFIKCCQRTMPQSFNVLLQLHHVQLKSVFETCPEIRPALAAHIKSLNEQQMAHIPQSLQDLILVS